MSGAFSKLNLMRSKDSLNKSSENSKDPAPITDGAADPHTSITIDEGSRPHEGLVDRSKSKKEKKKRDKSQGPVEKTEHHENHHHNLHRGRGRAKDVPDRECIVM
jgi:hypothetical protein